MSFIGTQRSGGVSNLSRNFNRTGGNTPFEAQNVRGRYCQSYQGDSAFLAFGSHHKHSDWALYPDPDDHKVLECAVVGGATHIVTGDRRHLLSLGSYQGIAIVSAADFLALVATS
jgi:hypothetical protein